MVITFILLVFVGSSYISASSINYFSLGNWFVKVQEVKEQKEVDESISNSLVGYEVILKDSLQYLTDSIQENLLEKQIYLSKKEITKTQGEFKSELSEVVSDLENMNLDEPTIEKELEEQLELDIENTFKKVLEGI
ncbi:MULTISPECIES: hypothetical protein [unclassified Psychrobacillus]|uniref:hypothetical protein n=1 Tax=unclassified Psychrobacillus TaxID=2636677 RepID=UPI00203AA5C9|nr:hypothetical protein [Psychrobacillus sp. MER TA 171]MCM3357435.1 hypothetical protein [Psychrobacillus sp. MER TA 171]